MTTQSNGFPAPGLKEADRGVIYLDKIKGDLQGIVPQYSYPSPGDQITFTVDSGNTTVFSKVQHVPEGDSEQAFLFSIPKAFFEKVHASGNEAELYYVVLFAREMRPVVSQKVRVIVKK